MMDKQCEHWNLSPVSIYDKCLATEQGKSEIKLLNILKTRKNPNFDCTDTTIPFTAAFCQINKFSIQELDLDRSVCMAAICYSSPNSTISS